jgi:hypothetical protein
MSTLIRYMGWEQGAGDKAAPQRTVPSKFVIKIVFGIHQGISALKYGDTTPL